MTKTKHKPHKGLRKRVKITASGKVKFKRSFAGHLMSGKSGRRRQRLRKMHVLQSAIADNIKRSLGCE
jgi:large subunit ribosomal protein L35